MSSTGVQTQKSVLTAFRDSLLAPANIHMMEKVGASMVKPEHMVYVAVQAAAKTKALLNYNRESMFLELAKCAQLGLEPDGMQAALVPYKSEAKLIIMYQGMIELSHRSGLVTDIQAHAVHEKDEFAYRLGTKEFLHHQPYDGADEPGPLTHAYAVTTYKDGAIKFRVMNRREIEAIRKKSPNGSRPDSPWIEHYDAMACKTVIRNYWKYSPKSPEIRRAIQYEEADEAGLNTRWDVGTGSIIVDDNGEPKAATIAGKITAPEPTQIDPPPPPDGAGSSHRQDPNPDPGEAGDMFTPEPTTNEVQKKRDEIWAMALTMNMGVVDLAAKQCATWFDAGDPLSREDLKMLVQARVDEVHAAAKEEYDVWRKKKTAKK